MRVSAFWLRASLLGGLIALAAGGLLQLTLVRAMLGMPRRIYTYDTAGPQVGWSIAEPALPLDYVALAGLVFGLAYAFLARQTPAGLGRRERAKLGALAGVAGTAVAILAGGIVSADWTWLPMLTLGMLPLGAFAGAFAGFLMPAPPEAG